MRITLMIIISCLSSCSYGQAIFHSIIKGSDNELVPEGIAVDNAMGRIYISSIAKKKIVVIDSNGLQTDFIVSSAGGFLEGLGMKLDSSRKLLWAISVKADSPPYISKIFAFDLNSAEIKHEFILSDTTPVMFNDLVLDQKGNVYITDTYGSSLYFIDVSKNELSLFTRSPHISYPNGIAIGKNNSIYLATYGKGPVVIDPTTKKTNLLAGYKDTVIAHGLDGLVYWNNSLVGVYNYNYKKNSFDTALIVRYLLDDAGTRIIGEEYIDRGNKIFAQPTTMAIAGNELWVLANSHLEVYNSNKQSLKGKEHLLQPLTIVHYKLR